MPTILLFWLMISEASVCGMAVGLEPSYQNSVTFCSHVTDDSKGTV